MNRPLIHAFTLAALAISPFLQSASATGSLTGQARFGTTRQSITFSTSPSNNGDNTFQITPIAPDTFRLEWPTAVNSQYQVQSSPDLTTWTQASPTLTASAPTTSTTVTSTTVTFSPDTFSPDTTPQFLRIISLNP